MIARCIIRFRDLKTGEMREAGETFETTTERLSEINSTAYGRLAEEVPEKPRRRTARTKTKEQ